MKKPPIFIRPTNICSLPLGIDLIPWNFRVLANFGGAEKKILAPHFYFLDTPPKNKTRSVDKLVTDARAKINALKKNFEVWLLPYQPTHKLKAICKKEGWRMAFNDPKLSEQIENKAELEKLFAGTDFLIPAKNYERGDLSFEKLRRKWGKKFVAQQIPQSGLQPSGGKSTFFIASEDNFMNFLKKIKRNEIIRVSKFVSGNVFSISACIVGGEILAIDCFLLLIGIPEMSQQQTIFCGSDPAAASRCPSVVKKQSRKIVKFVGEKLKKMNYRGHFNIDFIFDAKKSKTYLVEINPRLGGTTGVTYHAQKRLGIPSLLEYHIRAFLDEEIPTAMLTTDTEKMRRDLPGAQIIIRQQQPRAVKIKKAPRSGIYRIRKNELEFLREGWNPMQLKNSKEVLIYGLAPQKSWMKPGERIANIFSWDSVSQGSYELKPEFASAVKWLYQQFKFE